MMKHFYQSFTFSLFFLLLVSSLSFGQEESDGLDIPTVVPPSPNAASLGKYGDIPVSPYTGVPNIDIPIYEIVSGDIRVPISLSYHASGLKVGEEASRVGLGWALNAGGVITRTVFGEDDFQDFWYFDTSIPELPEGPDDGPTALVQSGNKPMMYTTYANGEVWESPLDLSHYITNTSQYDFQPDQFSYNFIGHSGKFVLKRNKEVVLLKQDKISIKFPDEGANSWEIITSDGYQYFFQVYETYTDNTNTTDGVPGIHKSSWYLTKIVSPAGKEVTFNYQQLGSQYIKPVGAYSETSQPISEPVDGECPFPCSTQSSLPGIPSGKEYSMVVLESIDFDNGQVVFEYEDRIDLEGDKRLKNIHVYRTNANRTKILPAIKTFAFTYDYFTSTMDKDYLTGGSEDYVTKRLKLLSLQELSGSDITKVKNPYVFTYYEGSNYLNLPAKTSFARDHWGYYNGKYGNTSLIPEYLGNNSTNKLQWMMGSMDVNRNTDPAYVKAFSLKEIQYPTKGKTILEYEGHTFDVKESRKRDETQFAEAPTLEETYKTMMYGDQNTNVVFEKELDLSDLYLDKEATTATVSFSAAIRPSSACTEIYINGSDAYFELYNSDGLRIGQVYLSDMTCSGYVYEYTNTYFLSPGKYTWKAFISSTNTTVQDISVTYSYYREKGVDPVSSDGKVYDFAGGLRIKRIIDEDDVTGLKNIKKYNYHYQEDRNSDGTPEKYSYGIRMAVPRYSYFDIVQEKRFRSDVGNTDYCNCVRLIRNSESNIPLNGSAAGSVVGYSLVEVLLGENGENGKTRYEYENLPDQTLNYAIESSGPLGTIPLRPAPVPSIPFERNGMLSKQTDYVNRNGTFTKVKEVIHQNESMDNRLIYGIDKRNHVKLGYAGSEIDGSGATSPDPLMPDEVFLFFYPSLNSTRTFVSKTIERNYTASGEFATRETEYLYENLEHLQPTTIITSLNNGKQRVTKIKYPADFSNTVSGPIISEMKETRFMHSLPIEKTIFIREGGVDKVIARSVHEFDDFYGRILKKAVYSLEINKPLPLTEVTAYTPNAQMPEAYPGKVAFNVSSRPTTSCLAILRLKVLRVELPDFFVIDRHDILQRVF